MTTDVIADPVGSWAPLRYAPFRILVTGRTINQLGSSIAGFALGFAILDAHGSLVDVGYVVAARMTAYIVFVLFGGVIADRLPRHLLMVGGSIVSGLSQGIAATLFLTHHATIPILIVLASINGISSAVTMPASAAIMPQTIPSTMRKQANAISRLTSNTVGILSLGVAGLLVTTIGSGWCVAVDASSFFIAACFFASTRILKTTSPDALTSDVQAPVKEKHPSLFTSLREGWRVFIGHTWLWVVVVGFMVFNAAASGGIGVLSLHFADVTVGRRLWSIVLAGEAIGSLLGVLLVMRIKVKRFLAYGTVAVAAGALLPLALVVAPNFFILFAAAFLGGMGSEQFGIAWETTMQENIETDMLARVYSYDMLGSFIAIPIGQLAVGPAAHAFGPRPTMFAVGIAMLASVVFMLAAKSVWQVKHDPKPAPADQIPQVAALPAGIDPQRIDAESDLQLSETQLS